MLDDHFSTAVATQPWSTIAARAVLPCAEEAFFRPSGASLTTLDSRRRYCRIRVRKRVTIVRGSNALAAYTLDVSPAGIGFYSPVQLYPRERIVVSFDEHVALELQITRCRRMRRQCYSCGGNFVRGNMHPGTYRELLRFLKV